MPDADRALIDAYIRRHGVTVCPDGDAAGLSQIEQELFTAPAPRPEHGYGRNYYFGRGPKRDPRAGLVDVAPDLTRSIDWTPEIDAAIRAGSRANKSWGTIADDLGLLRNAVRARARNVLQLPNPLRRRAHLVA